MPFLPLTPQNLANEYLCCIIRPKKIHKGIEAKRVWLSERFKEGHIYKKPNQKLVCLSNMPRSKIFGFHINNYLLRIYVIKVQF